MSSSALRSGSASGGRVALLLPAGIRTREALAVRRQQGVRLGGPRRCPDDVLARVVTRRAAGAPLRISPQN